MACHVNFVPQSMATATAQPKAPQPSTSLCACSNSKPFKSVKLSSSQSSFISSFSPSRYHNPTPLRSSRAPNGLVCITHNGIWYSKRCVSVGVVWFLNQQVVRCAYESEPLRVMISGAPASGKGTQCELITQKVSSDTRFLSFGLLLWFQLWNFGSPKLANNRMNRRKYNALVLFRSDILSWNGWFRWSYLGICNLVFCEQAIHENSYAVAYVHYVFMGY